MRSPAVAFSFLAAATAVSVSASSLPSPTSLDSTTLSPKPGAIDLDGSGIKNHAHLRDAGAGLGLSGYDASPLHLRRAVGRSHNLDEARRPGELPHSVSRPEPPERPEGGVVGCNDPDATSESTIFANALYEGGQNGGVSCSSSVQGASAGSGGQDGSKLDAHSPDAASSSGSSVQNSGGDGILNQGLSGGTSTSNSVIGNSANQPQDRTTAFGTYPGQSGARTASHAARELAARTPQGDKLSLYEADHGASTVVTAHSMGHAMSLDCAAEDIDCGTTNGLPGQSIYGNANPGSGSQGSGAYPGTPGPSGGGQVIEPGSDNAVDR